MDWFKTFRILGFPLILAAVGAASFYVSHTHTVQTQVATIVEPPAAQASVLQVLSDNAISVTGTDPVQRQRSVVLNNDVPFVGELNGFTFYNPITFDQEAFLLSWSPKCRLTARGHNITHVDSDAALGSRLNFTATQLPPGAQLTQTVVSACQGDIFAISRDYSLPAAQIQVNRRGRQPLVAASAPNQLLQSTTINGRPAVIGLPDYPKGRMVIHMRDNISLIDVSCFQLEIDQCIKVAEGVK